MSTTSRLIFSTIDDPAAARRLARDLVDTRLAACVNIVPSVASIYRWKGEIEETEELLLIIKTASDRVAPLTQWLEEAHPYEVPEIVVMEIESGHEPYLAWVISESRPESPGGGRRG